MNAELQEFARKRLAEMLAELGDGERRIFKLMYAYPGTNRTAEERESMPIEDVIAKMQPSHLDWAMQQCSNTLKKYASLPKDGAA